MGMRNSVHACCERSDRQSRDSPESGREFCFSALSAVQRSSGEGSFIAARLFYDAHSPCWRAGRVAPAVLIGAQYFADIVVLCCGSVSSRSVATAVRSRRAAARLLHYEAGQGRRIRREHPSISRADRELDSRPSRNLPPCAISVLGSARSCSLVALVTESEGRNRRGLQPSNGAEPARAFGPESGKASHDCSDPFPAQ